MSQTCSNSLHDSMFKFFTLKRKLEFTDNFGSHFIEVILYITTWFRFLKSIRYQNSISKHTDRHVIRGCWRKEKFFTRKVWEDSAPPNIPFWGHLNIDLCISFLPYFKSQTSNFSKTLEVFGPQGAIITTVFLTLWLAGHWGCVRRWKSLNNGIGTSGIVLPYSPPARFRNIRKKLHLFAGGTWQTKYLVTSYTGLIKRVQTTRKWSWCLSHLPVSLFLCSVC